MVRVACPGSFDPLTHGHERMVRRAAALWDDVIVAVGINPAKTRLFSDDERVQLAQEVLADLPNVRVLSFSGLLVDWCRDQQVSAIVKGLRSAADLDAELPQAHMNQHLAGIDTVYLPAESGAGFISSSLVKEVVLLGGDVSALVPPAVAAALAKRLS